MRKMLIALAGAAGLVLAAGTAHAATFSPYLGAISVGGGVADFARPAVRDITSPSGTWDARLLIGTRTPLAFEAAYAGTAGAEQDPTAKDATVTSTAVTGNLRLNLTTWRIQPFIVGGAGWINLHSFGRDSAPIAAERFAHNDNGVIVPVGGGLATYIGKHGMIDARGSYDFVTKAGDFTNAGSRPDMWRAELRAGYAF